MSTSTHQPQLPATLAAMDKTRIGALVRAKRIAKDISYREMQDLTGLSTRSIQQIENAENNYGIDTLAAVCKVLGLDITVSVVPTRAKRKP